jgi:peptidoglycan/LPS O-acetylase OafA/YrhL
MKPIIFHQPGMLSSFEALRFFAAVFVVWIHASIGVDITIHPDSGFAGRFAVPFFALSSAFFTALSVWGKPKLIFSDYVLQRLRRIYLPFAAWTAIYICLKAIGGRHPQWSLSLFLGGGSYHLWFLPFVFALCLLIFPLSRLLKLYPASSMKMAVGMALLGVMAAAIPDVWIPETNVSNTLKLWLGPIPAAIWGFVLAYFYGFHDRAWLTRKFFRFAGVPFAVFCILASIGQFEVRFLYNLAALSLAIWALAINEKIGTVFPVKIKYASLGSLAFGIYLSHIMFLGPMRSIAASYGLETTVTFAVLATLLVLLVSSVFTFVLLKIRWLRWLT